MPAVWKKTIASTELVQNVTERFHSAFGAKPAGIYSAPGRANLLGEHIDYCGGTVLPFALPQRTYVAMSSRQDGQIRATTAQGDAGTAPDQDIKTISFSEVAPGELNGWLSYVAGIPWAMAAEDLGDFTDFGADIAIDSSVPLGAGLSSSAALECAVALGVDDVLSTQDQARERLADTDEGRAALATAAIRAENEIAGASTGGMDQSISLRASEGTVLAIDCRDFSTRALTIDVESAGLAILIMDTRAHHNLSDGQYAARRASTEVAKDILGLASLRDAFEDAPTLAEAETLLTSWDTRVCTLSLPEGTDPATMRDALEHVWTEIARVEECISLFADSQQVPDNTWERLGTLLNGSHDSLRYQYKVSCDELDVAVEAARAAGALGARMTGGGFGGSAIALVRQDDIADIADAVATAFEKAGFDYPEFLIASPSAPAHVELLEAG